MDGMLLDDNGYSSITVGPNLAAGRHRLTLLALKGVVLSSADFVFEVEPAGGFVEDFNDGLAQGWNLHGNFAVQNAMLYSNPAYTDSWKGCEYGQSQFTGAFEYKTEYHAFPGSDNSWTKGMWLGAPSVSGTGVPFQHAVYFCVAGSYGSYSWWVGVGDLSGDLSWSGWQAYYSYSDTVTLKIKSNGSGYFEFYLDGNLVYGLTDTAASQGYVGFLFYDGSSYSSTQFAFDTASLLPSAAPSMMGPDLFGASRLRPCRSMQECSAYLNRE